MTYQKDCPHCDPNSFALKHPLLITDNFYMVCDVHSITEGHILILPKDHISCVGAFSPELFAEFTDLYDRVSKFEKATYGKMSSFEHGIIGQTVYHAHVQIMPFDGKPEDIVPEGLHYLRPIRNIGEVKDAFQRDGKYLFFSIGDNMWLVNTTLGVSRFFRDRFARALGVPERGNWKNLKDNPDFMDALQRDIHALESKWKVYFKK